MVKVQKPNIESVIKTDLNFVFIASFRNSDIDNIPEINYCGNILTIYEKTDSYGVSALDRKKVSSCDLKHFKEIKGRFLLL